MASLNLVVVIGHLGRDPELRHTGTGTAVCNFSLATSETWGGEKKTTWHNVTCWKGTAEAAAKYLTKGSMVCVVGSIEIQEYQTKDGTQKQKTVIQARDVQFLDTKKPAQPQSPYETAHPKPRPQEHADTFDDDGLPF